VDTDANGSFTSAVDVPIAPRQRLTTTPYSFRARIADSLTASAVDVTALAANAVTTVKIIDGAVTGLKIFDGSIATVDLANLSVDNSKLAALAVDNAKLANGSVDSNKVLDNSLTTNDILDNTLTANDIADNSIGNAELADNSVSSANIIDGSIGVADLAPTVGLWTVNAVTGAIYRPAGLVGIGTATPNRPLTIDNTNGLGIGDEVTTGATSLSLSLTSDTGGQALIQAIKSQGSTFGNVILNPLGGRVAVGGTAASNPLAPLHVFGSASSTFTLEGYVDTNGAGDTQIFNFTHAVGIIADSAMRASSFYVVSDARVKKNLSLSDGATDLATLMGVEVTDYTFKDVIANGSSPQKRVIAQQVEKVYPQAVNQSTSVVPDIFQKAGFKDGWVTLATDLKPGERVRLIGSKGESVHEVLEVAEGRFRTAFTTEGDKVFVYGREVKDFRTVDYDAIAMLNVSATQQIKKEKDAEVKALQEKNAALTKQIAALDQRLATQEQQFAELKASEKVRETKLAAIEKLLEAAVSTGSTTRTVSLKTASAK
jgi:hypothetical protein